MKHTSRRSTPGGFTLVELLIVVGIIALLVSMLVPTLARAKFLANLSVCAANMNAVGKAVRLYMTTDAPSANGPTVGNNTDKGWRAIGAARFAAYDPTGTPDTATGNTRDPWLLVSQNYVPDGSAFICPATKDTRSPRSDGGLCYDFRDNTGISYSYQVQRRGLNARYAIKAGDDTSLVIMADRNPASASWTVFSGGVQANFDNSLLQANSLNHKKEGQNVLTVTATVKFAADPKAGVDGDNIWTANNAGADEDLTGASNQYPRTRKDSLLAP